MHTHVIGTVILVVEMVDIYVNQCSNRSKRVHELQKHSIDLKATHNSYYYTIQTYFHRLNITVAFIK